MLTTVRCTKHKPVTARRPFPWPVAFTVALTVAIPLQAGAGSPHETRDLDEKLARVLHRAGFWVESSNR
jgi:hypothetical protein